MGVRRAARGNSRNGKYDIVQLSVCPELCYDMQGSSDRKKNLEGKEYSTKDKEAKVTKNQTKKAEVCRPGNLGVNIPTPTSTPRLRSLRLHGNGACKRVPVSRAESYSSSACAEVVSTHFMFALKRQAQPQIFETFCRSAPLV